MSDSDGDLILQDRVLVEIDLRGQVIGFRTVVAKIRFSELWLGLQSPDSRLEKLEERQPVHLTVARQGWALTGNSMFLRHLGPSRSRLFAVVRPLEFTKVQRRAYGRIGIERPVFVRRLDPVVSEPRGRSYTGSTINLSPRGALFEAALPVKVDEELDLTFALSATERISATARVIRAVPAQQEPGAAAGDESRSEVAVEFESISAADEQLVIRHILQANRRKREMAIRADPNVGQPGAVPGNGSVRGNGNVERIPWVRPAAGGVAEGARAQAQVAVPAATPVDFEGPASGESLLGLGVRICLDQGGAIVRFWFDGLPTRDRVALLTELQNSLAKSPAPGDEAVSTRPMARALGLVAPG
jgi:hypothetical protein